MVSESQKYVSSDPLDYITAYLFLKNLSTLTFDNPQNFNSSKISSSRACDWILGKEHYEDRIVGDWSV